MASKCPRSGDQVWIWDGFQGLCTWIFIHFHVETGQGGLTPINRVKEKSWEALEHSDMFLPPTTGEEQFELDIVVFACVWPYDIISHPSMHLAWPECWQRTDIWKYAHSHPNTTTPPLHFHQCLNAETHTQTHQHNETEVAADTFAFDPMQPWHGSPAESRPPISVYRLNQYKQLVSHVSSGTNASRGRPTSCLKTHSL